MAELLREDSGLPKPQYEKEDGSGFEALKVKVVQCSSIPKTDTMKH